MTKPRAIKWLEAETGARIEYTREPSGPGADRHLSVRLPGELAAGLERIASERGMTLSQLVRDVLTETLRQRTAVSTMDARTLADRLAADVAEVRRRLAG
jgi:predicted DNA-binding protein